MSSSESSLSESSIEPSDASIAEESLIPATAPGTIETTETIGAVEILGITLVVAVALVGFNALIWWLNKDETISEHKSHNQYNNIEKYYKFLASSQLKLSVSSYQWNDIKQIYQKNKHNYNKFKNKVKSKITNFHKENHNWWREDISDADIDILIKVLFNHFETINKHFSSAHNHGWKIVTNVANSYFELEAE